MHQGSRSESGIVAHDVQREVLPNGITLVTVPLEHTAAVTTIVLFGVGTRYESEQQRGLAHFTEHMLFKGGNRYPTAQLLAQTLDAVGGEFNAYTSQEFTGYYTKTAAQHLGLSLDVLADMVLNARFPDEELAKEKGVIVEEINMNEDIPMRKVEQVFSTLTFGNGPLGRPILGTKGSVTAFTSDDFRAYRQQFYCGARCVIVIAGAVNHPAARPLVEKYFAPLTNGSPFQPEPAHFQSLGSEGAPSKVAVVNRKSEQTHLVLGVRGLPHTHPDRYALRVLATILGGNMSSRLFVSVREQQGLCYYIRSAPDSYLDEGALEVVAGVDNARLSQAVAAILAELAKLRDQPVGEDELERAKQFLTGKLLLGTEDSEQLAELYGMQQLLEREVTLLPTIEARIKAVTVADVQRLAQERFVNEWLRLAVVGPQEAEPLETALKLP